ncbi:hypothetical protein EZV62_001364 [Acer yangbiense]|uniref:ASCH domain-containing protein n=1 Tax=Acer yangbiense TaxID=1000413 RepID=A0A5C7IUB3_9ROSI|nr:hypothetical protein EZV62_001364 [Acer yangbiense]
MNRLQNCMEELVKFTLLSHINQTLDFNIGLSLEFCSGLLKPEPDDDAVSRSAGVDFDYGSPEGVPLYPLYKRLASALYCSVNQRAFCKTCEVVGLINEDDFSKQREKEWSGLLLDKGSGLVNILEAVDFELHVQEHFFSLIKDGVKTVEGRCAVGDYNRIGSGATILLNKCMLLEVQYALFSEMLEAESLEKVLPGVQTIEEGVQIYRKFYVEEKERSNGVLAICVSKMPAQPYISLASILSNLGIELLGNSKPSRSCTYCWNNVKCAPPSKIISSLIIYVSIQAK